MESRLAIAPSSLPLRLLVVADVRILLPVPHVRSEVPERDERLGAGVLDRDALDRRLVRDEHFVLGHLAEADQDGGLDLVAADLALALDRDDARGARVLDGDLGAGLDRQLARR